jgi:predicted helicase
VTRDAHGHVLIDPNNLEDERAIIRLIGQVITVSLKTVELIASLPPIFATDDAEVHPGE